MANQGELIGQVAIPVAGPTPWMDWMRQHVGEIQQTGAKPTAFTIDIFKYTNYPTLTDSTPESCAATICAALEKNGYSSTHRADAISFANYGTPCDLTPGCIVVFEWETGGHHVTFCDEILDQDYIRGLGGNQTHELQDSTFSRRRIIAKRWPVKASARSTLMSMKLVDHSSMHLGKRHARHDPRVPALARYLPTASLPPPPDQVDWYSKVARWGMMANDNLGDCTCAAIGHILLQWSTYASAAPRLLSDAQIIQLYETIGGYNPADPSTDQGAVEVDVLNYWLNDGVFEDKLAGYTSLEVGNTIEIKDAISWFGNVYIGVQLPMSAKTQSVWAVPPGGAVGEGSPGSWGGHAVPVVGYDARGLYCVTWGAIKRMTYEFWAAYCDEAYALLSRDFVDANNLTPNGINWDQLQSDMRLLKGGYLGAKAIRHI